jgi:hypothetical protein
MATELNHNTIKDQIVAILQADTTLYTTTGEANKLRKITTGFPPGGEMDDEMLPFAYVTNSPGTFETIKPGVAVSNAVKVLIHTVFYDVVVVGDLRDARFTENLQDDLQQKILENIEEDHDLTGATSSVVDLCVPVKVAQLKPDEESMGKSLKGRIITLRCQVTTG